MPALASAGTLPATTVLGSAGVNTLVHGFATLVYLALSRAMVFAKAFSAPKGDE